MAAARGGTAGAGARASVPPPSSFLASPLRAPLLAAPVAPARPYRFTPPVQMGRRSAKIAGRKGKADAKKAKVYGKIGKKIVQVVKSGGADPVTNSKLADILKQAKVRARRVDMCVCVLCVSVFGGGGAAESPLCLSLADNALSSSLPPPLQLSPHSNQSQSITARRAQELGVPKDVLDRNMKRASDAKQADYAECVYEAYGPGGTG